MKYRNLIKKGNERFKDPPGFQRKFGEKNIEIVAGEGSSLV